MVMACMLALLVYAGILIGPERACTTSMRTYAGLAQCADGRLSLCVNTFLLDLTYQKNVWTYNLPAGIYQGDGLSHLHIA